MIAQDFDEFSRRVNQTCRMLSRGGYMPDGEDLKQWFRILRGYSLDAVRYGLDRHMRDPAVGRFAPTPADIVAKIEARFAQDGRLGAEEAWARALHALDERQTVVWTEEMAEAFAAAKPLLLQGDKVGARMAFREIYARLVERARDRHELPCWVISEGHDPALRTVAVQAAVEAGHLALPQAQTYLALPPPRDPQSGPGEASVPLGGLPESVRSILMALKRQLSDKRLRPSSDAAARKATDDARALARERVASHSSSEVRAATELRIECTRQQEYL